MKDKQAPSIDYITINGKTVTPLIEAEKDQILQLKISITDEGGLSTHSVEYNINEETGDELIYISDEIVNTIVEEFYVDLKNMNKNSHLYSCTSGDLIEFILQAEDLSGNKLDHIFQVKIK